MVANHYVDTVWFAFYLLQYEKLIHELKWIGEVCSVSLIYGGGADGGFLLNCNKITKYVAIAPPNYKSNGHFYSHRKLI